MYSTSAGGNLRSLPDTLPDTAAPAVSGFPSWLSAQQGHAPSFGIRPAGTGTPGMVVPFGARPAQAGSMQAVSTCAQPRFSDVTGERIWNEYTNARSELFNPSLTPGMRFVMLMKVRSISHYLINEAWASLRPDLARDLMAVAMATDEQAAGELRPTLAAEIPGYFHGFVLSGLEAMNEKLRNRSFGGAILQAGLQDPIAHAWLPQTLPQQDWFADPTLEGQGDVQEGANGEVNEASQAEAQWPGEFASEPGAAFKEEYLAPAEASGDEPMDEYSGESSSPQQAASSARTARNPATRAPGRKTGAVYDNLRKLKEIRDRLAWENCFDHVALTALLKGRLAFRSHDERQKFAKDTIDHFVDLLHAKNDGVEVDDLKLRNAFITLLKKMCSFHKLNARAGKRRREEEGSEPLAKPEVDETNIHLLRCLHANPELLRVLRKVDKKTIDQLRRSLGVYVKIEIIEMLEKKKISLSAAQIEYIFQTSFMVQTKTQTMIAAARKACPQEQPEAKPAMEPDDGAYAGDEVASDDSINDGEYDDYDEYDDYEG